MALAGLSASARRPRATWLSIQDNDWVSSDSVKNTPIEELHSKHPSLEKTEEESEEDLDNDETRMVEETESRNL